MALLLARLEKLKFVVWLSPLLNRSNRIVPCEEFGVTNAIQVVQYRALRYIVLKLSPTFSACSLVSSRQNPRICSLALHSNTPKSPTITIFSLRIDRITSQTASQKVGVIIIGFKESNPLICSFVVRSRKVCVLQVIRPTTPQPHNSYNIGCRPNQAAAPYSTDKSVVVMASFASAMNRQAKYHGFPGPRASGDSTTSRRLFPNTAD
jgi:hypothetical protein